MVGATVSRLTTGVMLLAIPTLLVPTMVSVRAPSAPRSKLASDQIPEETTAGCPLTVTDTALPEPPERLTMRVLTHDPGTGELSVSTGGGTVVTVTRALLLLPVRSVATAVIVAGEEPDRLSV